jgi:hypothetical protein
MKRLLLLTLVLPLISVAAYGQTCTGSKTLMKHVYHPDRLVEQKGAASQLLESS